MDHNLHTPWTFYYFEKSEQQNSKEAYDKCIHKIGKVHTIEDFWTYYSHIVRPDKLEPNISLHFFRNDSRAMWEDPENQQGGAFFCNIEKEQTKYLWERLLINLIGEQFPEDVIGVVVTTRPKFDFIYVWHQTSANEEVRLEICRKLEKIFELPLHYKIGYNAFNQKFQDQHINYFILQNGPALRSKTNSPKQKKQ
ncbi:Eukaryotic translation initiation factor 4E-4 [Tritrichomonas foetus]|uniref:Eukaryotic translation initiation factor 4E-4 n=1 Tax=Tritrichomonas foetus TaxID=1144522 RepID=A0A1J4JDD8_9EUKA|nr:Eukaryotic translation initiation factor 4E-4 [Tritrichomonas foetus]|eukprot:OHS97214.1 Eukaryotic translation initiation factor 4E-4 [Tritrichomonas foetus]